MIYANHLMANTSFGPDSENARVISHMTTHDLRVVLQQLDMPNMVYKFSSHDREVMRNDVCAELLLRCNIRQAIESEWSEGMLLHLGHVTEQQAYYGTIEIGGITGFVSTFRMCLIEHKRQEPYTGEIFNEKKARNEPYRANYYDAYVKPMRARYKRPNRRSFNDMETSVPVDQYGTDKYE